MQRSANQPEWWPLFQYLGNVSLKSYLTKSFGEYQKPNYDPHWIRTWKNKNKTSLETSDKVKGSFSQLGLSIRKPLLGKCRQVNLTVAYFVFRLLANMESAVAATLQAMRMWESKTCIRFVERTTEKAYLELFRGQGWVRKLHVLGPAPPFPIYWFSLLPFS